MQPSFFLVQLGKLAQVRGGVFAVLLLGAIVWALALVGILSLSRVVGAPSPGWSLPSLETNAEGFATAIVPGLPEYPGAKRSEFRDEVFGDERVVEIEYVVDSGLPEVRAHYHDVLERGGWTVSDVTWIHGEWVYSVSCGARRGFVEIEHQDGRTEVEVEMAEPASLGRFLEDR